MNLKEHLSILSKINWVCGGRGGCYQFKSFNSIQDQREIYTKPKQRPRGFQFYPRSTPIQCRHWTYRIQVFQFYPRSTRTRRMYPAVSFQSPFNSIQDQRDFRKARFWYQFKAFNSIQDQQEENEMDLYEEEDAFNSIQDQPPLSAYTYTKVNSDFQFYPRST